MYRVFNNLTLVSSVSMWCWGASFFYTTEKFFSIILLNFKYKESLIEVICEENF